MNHPYSFPVEGIRVAYVRELAADEVPDEAPPGKFYAIHDDEGNRLAIAPSRDLAFAVVRRNDMMPVSVH